MTVDCESRLNRAASRKQIPINNSWKDKRGRDAAAVAWLMTHTGARVDSSDGKGVSKFKTFGASTLEGRHIKHAAGSGQMFLDYVPGKHHGENIKTPITDPGLKKELLRRKEAAGPSGKLFPSADYGTVNWYFKTQLKMKPKDSRTMRSTSIALEEIKNVKNIPVAESEQRKLQKAIASKAVEAIGHTPAIALKKYIHPSVWSRLEAL